MTLPNGWRLGAAVALLALGAALIVLLRPSPAPAGHDAVDVAEPVALRETRAAAHDEPNREPQPPRDPAQFEITSQPPEVMPLAVEASDMAHLAGRVLRGELPVGGATIHVRRVTNGFTGDGGPALVSLASADDGSFAVELAPSAWFSVDATIGDEHSVPVDHVGTSRGSVHEIALQLANVPWVDGVVMDADGIVVPGARVELSCPGASDGSWLATQSLDVIAFSDAGGQFEIVSPRMGSALLAVETEDHCESEPIGLAFSSDSPHVTVTVRLERVAFISGRVHLPQGRPFPGVRVCAKSGPDPPTMLPGSSDPFFLDYDASAATNLDGTFRLGPLEADAVYQLWFARPGIGRTPLVLPDISAGTSGLDVVIDRVGP